MLRLRQGPVVAFDIDDTLVTWGNPHVTKDVELRWLQVPGRPSFLVGVHTKHIQNLKDHFRRGHPVVVWSAGGEEWAAAVVESLELTNYVDLVMSKPTWFYDDQKSDHFLSEDKRRFFPWAEET